MCSCMLKIKFSEPIENKKNFLKINALFLITPVRSETVQFKQCLSFLKKIKFY